MTKTFYMRNRMVFWKDIKLTPNVDIGGPITFEEGVDGSVALYLLYDNLGAFQKAWPDEMPLPIYVEVPDVTH